MLNSKRKSGIDIIGDVPWGTHFCQFYGTKEDLIDVIIPYFKAGLTNNEFCMWVTSEHLDVEDAKESLGKVLPDINTYLENGQLEILPYNEWYLEDGVFDSKKVSNGWIDKLNTALKNGFDGLRLTGNTFWLEEEDWNDFVDYEKEVNLVINNYNMIAMCTYNLDKCNAGEIIDVVNNHEFALIKRESEWRRVESSEKKKMEHALKESEEYFHVLADNIPNLAWMANADGWVFWYNKQWYEYTGTTLEEMQGWGWRKIQHPDYVEAVTEEWSTHIKEGKPYDNIFPLKSKDGDYHWFLTRVTPIQDNQGKLHCWFGTNTDITKLKQAEEEIKRNLRVLKGINKVFLESLVSGTEENVISKCLEVAEELTDSEFGFFGEINENEHLDDSALSSPGWDAFEAPPGKANELLTDMEIVSYWGRTVKEGKTQIINNLQSDSDCRDVPRGHPPIKSFLGVPLKQTGETIGMIALANKKGGYTEQDKENIETLSVAFVEALLRKKAEKHKQELLKKEVWLTEELRDQGVSLMRLNRLLRAHTNSNHAMMRAEDEVEYLDDVCRIIVEDCGHKMVWIGYAEEDENKTVRPVAYHGFDENYLANSNITWDDNEMGSGPTGIAIRTGEISLCKNMHTDPKFKPWREEAIKRGYTSSIVIPLMNNGKAFGALTIYSTETNPFNEDEQKLLEYLADDLSYGIKNIRLNIEKSKAEKTNQKMLEKEQQLTEELQASNEELKSTMEKLLISNEELQAITEELSTANEELQNQQYGLKTLIDKLEISNRELEQFAYIASHDLQEPLRMVSSFTQLLERKYKSQLDEDADVYINFIVEGSHRMKDLIDDLLTFSRLNTQAKPFKPFEVKTALDSVLSYLQSLIDENNATITYDSLPIIKGDSSQIQQLFQNLLSNALFEFI